jgi:hypothetical protein
MYKLLDEEFLKQLKEDGAVEEGKTLTQQQLDSQKAQIFSHMNKVFGYVRSDSDLAGKL